MRVHRDSSRRLAAPPTLSPRVLKGGMVAVAGALGPGFRVQGSGFRVQGAGCRVQGAGCGVQGLAWPTRSPQARWDAGALGAKAYGCVPGFRV